MSGKEIHTQNDQRCRKSMYVRIMYVYRYNYACVHRSVGMNIRTYCKARLLGVCAYKSSEECVYKLVLLVKHTVCIRMHLINWNTIKVVVY